MGYATWRIWLVLCNLLCSGAVIMDILTVHIIIVATVTLASMVIFARIWPDEDSFIQALESLVVGMLWPLTLVTVSFLSLAWLLGKFIDSIKEQK
jgi:hypothetical protein